MRPRWRVRQSQPKNRHDGGTGSNYSLPTIRIDELVFFRVHLEDTIQNKKWEVQYRYEKLKSYTRVLCVHNY